MVDMQVADFIGLGSKVKKNTQHFKALLILEKQLVGKMEFPRHPIPPTWWVKIEAKWELLAHRYKLNDIAQWSFWLVAAQALDPQIHHLYRTLAGGAFNQSALHRAFVRKVLDPTGQYATELLEALSPHGPLLGRGLLEQVGGDGLGIPQTVMDWLGVDQANISPAIRARLPYCYLRASMPFSTEEIELILGCEQLAKLRRTPPCLLALSGHKQHNADLVADVLTSPRASGICHTTLAEMSKLTPSDVIFLARDLVLENRALHIRVDLLEQREEGAAHADPRHLLPLIVHWVGILPSIVLSFSSEAVPTEWLELLDTHPYQEVRTRSMDRETRERYWRFLLQREEVDDVDALAEPVSRFPLSVGDIHRALLRGKMLTQRHLTDDALILNALLEGTRHISVEWIGPLATRVTTTAAWSDLILPKETLEQIDAVRCSLRHRDKVYNAWGYGRTMGYGKGLTALFSGKSGTGKTLCAGLLCDEMGLVLYQIHLNRVVSKYIGETEKQLEEVFAVAEQGGVALLFDEADSLFARRTAVKSSTDRYSNLVVNYLLQRMERFDGLVILTTNNPDQIDSAFQRRIRHKIIFELPDEEQRNSLWRGFIPNDAPQEEQLKLDVLAKVFELSGGQIRNCVLRAAFLAAREDVHLNNIHLRRAAEEEYRSAGHLIPASNEQ